MVMLDGPLPAEPEGASVLVVMAHPDDAEFGCGGTIARWAAAGKEINYVLCTSGDKGSSDPAMSPHKVREVYMSTQQNADLWIDVTSCFERKLAGLREHTSQVGDRFDQVVERIKERSRALAKAQGLEFEYAEGYKYFRLD